MKRLEIITRAPDFNVQTFECTVHNGRRKASAQAIVAHASKFGWLFDQIKIISIEVIDAH